MVANYVKVSEGSVKRWYFDPPRSILLSTGARRLLEQRPMTFFETISILIPTRNGIENLGRLIRSMRQSESDWSSIEVLFRCDDDDLGTIQFLRGEGFAPLIGPRYGGYRSVPTFINELFAQSTGDLLFLLNDDSEFISKGWAEQILETANRYPDGIFNIGVNTELNSYMHPFPILSRRYVEIIGGACHDDLVCFDIYHLDIVRAFGRLVPLDSVVVRHNWIGKTDANFDPARFDSYLSDEPFEAPEKSASPFDSIYLPWRKDYKARHDLNVGIAIGATLDAMKANRGGASDPANRVAGTPLVSAGLRLNRAIRTAVWKFTLRRDISVAKSLFDRNWYLSQNSDVAAAKVDPLMHYLQYGGFEGRDPHPLFDSDWYLLRNQDVAVMKVNPLVHYLRHGGLEGRDPHPLFDSDWYLAENSDVAKAHVNPLVHYLRKGGGEGRCPNSVFDGDRYLAEHPDASAAGMNPLEHHVRRSK